MLSHLTLASSFILRVLNPTGSREDRDNKAIIKYVVYPQTITYIVYCHAKLQLKVILGSLWGRSGSLWVVVGSLWVVVGRCGVGVGRCGSLWDRCGSLWVVVGS